MHVGSCSLSVVIYVFSAFEDSSSISGEMRKKERMQYFNLVEPMYVNVAINLNTNYNPSLKHEPYQINVLISKVILSATPAMVKDFVFYRTLS